MSSPRKPRKEPRVIPRFDTKAIDAVLSAGAGRGTMVGLAQREFVMDRAGRPLTWWIDWWRSRWPDTSAKWWKQEARRRGWLEMRDRHAETLLDADAEIAALRVRQLRAFELQQLEDARKVALDAVLDEHLEFQSKEGAVRSLALLDKLVDDRRDVVRAPAPPAHRAAAIPRGAARPELPAPADDDVVDVEFIENPRRPELMSADESTRLARLLYEMRNRTEDGDAEEGDEGETGQATAEGVVGS